MQALNQFSIPIKGLKFGIHEYDFKILKSFFDAFPNSLTKDGNLDTHLTLDKKTDHLDLVFTTKGTLASECDRCTANIDLPIESTINFIVKFSDEEKTDGELFFIPIESHEINVAEMIYEHLLLSMPLIKVYDCENENPIPCNQKVLEILNHDKKPEKVVKNNVFGDALKNLKITKTK